MSAKVVLIDGGSPLEVTGSPQTKFIYNLLPVGRFYDKRYGEIYVSDSMIQSMVDNFDKFPSYEVPIKIGHGDGALSPGKVISLAAKPEGLEITFVVDADTSEAIRKKQYRYMSAEFDSEYIDKKTGESVGAVLLGAALVNQPADPWVEPLKFADIDFEDEKKGVDNMDEMKIKELEAKIAALEAEKAENAKKFSDLESTNKRLLADKLNAEVMAFCDGWTAKGVPPVVLEKVKPLLLSDGRTIKLSDGTDKPLIAILGDVFGAMPKVEMGQKGENGEHELTDYEKSMQLADAIAKVG